ncbi:hypothetical protein [Allosalinactinospora lopnorensis]|uniref:hypothetical protein n=1 Tax=Allosalinactinospora lopnorensis TaxID=1352348 RepID=UPI0012E1A4F5|nr:hypothetical protein [Allosalinactinospora lopnorensis]
MKYPQGGGSTAERREFRERLQLRAVEQFAHGEDNKVLETFHSRQRRHSALGMLTQPNTNYEQPT